MSNDVTRSRIADRGGCPTAPDAPKTRSPRTRAGAPAIIHTGGQPVGKLGDEQFNSDAPARRVGLEASLRGGRDLNRHTHDPRVKALGPYWQRERVAADPNLAGDVPGTAEERVTFSR